MSGPPGHPPYEPRYEHTFLEDRAKLGLNGADFDRFLEDLERVLRDYPYAESVEVPDGDGVRLLPTYRSFPDIPPLLIFYEVEDDPNAIVFLGISPGWSARDLPLP
jgi:hypothetical protein